jgi:hypothetical protein
MPSVTAPLVVSGATSLRCCRPGVGGPPSSFPATRPRLAGAQPGVTCGGPPEDQASPPGGRGGHAVIHLAAALTSRGGIDDEFFAANAAAPTTSSPLSGTPRHPDPLRYASSDAVYWGGAGPAFSPVGEPPAHPRQRLRRYQVRRRGALLTFGRTASRPRSSAPCHRGRGRAHRPRRCWQPMWSMRDPAHRDPPRRARDLALLAALKAIDDGTERLYVVGSRGRTAVSTSTMRAARRGDIALDKARAIGEAFNIGPVAPYGGGAVGPPGTARPAREHRDHRRRPAQLDVSSAKAHRPKRTHPHRLRHGHEALPPPGGHLMTAPAPTILALRPDRSAGGRPELRGSRPRRRDGHDLTPRDRLPPRRPPRHRLPALGAASDGCLGNLERGFDYYRGPWTLGLGRGGRRPRRHQLHPATC